MSRARNYCQDCGRLVSPDYLATLCAECFARPDHSPLDVLTIVSAAHDGCRDIHGFIVTNGADGADLRVFGWAANMRGAKKLRSDVRKSRAEYAQGAE